jgi:hypothetical protein
LGKRLTDVKIEAPSLNTRKISASIIVDTPMQEVWSILTDYNNLATHVPNLVKSYVVPNAAGDIRLFQEGAQKIIGFDFRASLLMQMQEEKDEDNKTQLEWKIDFKCAESRMFDAFDGQWSLKYQSRSVEVDPITKQSKYNYKSKLSYSVFVRPKGPVPVMALEWRIKEDIPTNLFAVKIASEKRAFQQQQVIRDKDSDGNSNDNNNNNDDRSGSNSSSNRESSLSSRMMDWAVDETLSSYVASKIQSNNNNNNNNKQETQMSTESAELVKRTQETTSWFNQQRMRLFPPKRALSQYI